MCAENKNTHHNALWSITNNRCPRCRQGKLYLNSNPYNLKHSVDMPEHCPVCGQPYELQTGFYFGTGYVSYALSVAVMATVFVAYAVLIGLSFRDNSIFWALGVGIVTLLLLQPIIQRLARSIWIAIFVRYDRNWEQTQQPGQQTSTHS